jgi:pimeloyl-ACP methyl ester carboxylesterase
MMVVKPRRRCAASAANRASPARRAWRASSQLGTATGLLVADRAGGELALTVAAAQPDRVTGLVVVKCGHPRVPDINGVVRDRHCPPVQADTTTLVSSAAAHAVARASRRHVHGEFRLAELAGLRRSRHYTKQLAAEVVVRSHSW